MRDSSRATRPPSVAQLPTQSRQLGRKAFEALASPGLQREYLSAQRHAHSQDADQLRTHACSLPGPVSRSRAIHTRAAALDQIDRSQIEGLVASREYLGETIPVIRRPLIERAGVRVLEQGRR